MHALSNTTIALDGDEAGAETYCLACHRGRARPAVQRLVPLGYVNRLGHSDGRWLIARRVSIYELASETVLDRRLPPAGFAARQDREDPSYAVLGG
jgi:hypothetical protein